MKKIIGLLVVVLVFVLSCEKKEVPQIQPIGKVVTFEWADTVDGIAYGIMREQESQKPHIVSAQINDDGSFKVLGIDGSKSEPVLQIECHCYGCGNVWCPNMNKTYGACISCPVSGHLCTSPFTYLPCGGGYCRHIWIE